MAQIEQVAKAALDRDSLQARSLTQDFFQKRTKLIDIPKPKVADEER